MNKKSIAVVFLTITFLSCNDNIKNEYYLSVFEKDGYKKLYITTGWNKEKKGDTEYNNFYKIYQWKPDVDQIGDKIFKGNAFTNDMKFHHYYFESRVGKSIKRISVWRENEFIRITSSQSKNDNPVFSKVLSIPYKNNMIISTVEALCQFKYNKISSGVYYDIDYTEIDNEYLLIPVSYVISLVNKNEIELDDRIKSIANVAYYRIILKTDSYSDSIAYYDKNFIEILTLTPTSNDYIEYRLQSKKNAELFFETQ